MARSSDAFRGLHKGHMRTMRYLTARVGCFTTTLLEITLDRNTYEYLVGDYETVVRKTYVDEQPLYTCEEHGQTMCGHVNAVRQVFTRVYAHSDGAG